MKTAGAGWAGREPFILSQCREGPPVAGGSAGAVPAGGNTAIFGTYDRNETGLEDLAGLGSIPHYNILPHYGLEIEPTETKLVRPHEFLPVGGSERYLDS